MSDNWLLADSFEQGSRLIEALNIILIHNKLLIAGAKGDQRSEDVERARSCLAHVGKCEDLSYRPRQDLEDR